MRTPNWPFFKTHYYGGIKKYQWTAIPCRSTASSSNPT